MSEPIIIDAHQHVGGLGNALGTWGEDSEGPDQERATRLAAMDALGIAASLIQPAHSYLKPDGIVDTRLVNDDIAAYRRAAPDRRPC